MKDNRRALEDQVAADRRSTTKRSPPRSIGRDELANELEAEMLEAATELAFERAAKLRDELARVRLMSDEVVEVHDDDDDNSHDAPKQRLTPPGSPGSKARRGRRK